MRPSYVYPATRAAFGKQEFIAGSGMMPGSGLSSTTLGTPKRSTRTSMRHQSRQPSARYASSATRSVSRQRREIECDDRQTAHVTVVAEDGHGELGSRQIGLDDDRLAVTI